MAATMLQLMQQATGEMGLAVPTVVAASTAQDTVQQLALLNAVGYELKSEFPWQSMVKQNIMELAAPFTFTGDTTVGNNVILNCSAPALGLDSTYQISGTGINNATYVASIAGNAVTITQAPTIAQTGATFTVAQVKFGMPSDYDRSIDRTHWDKSKHWEMIGPETPQQWEWLISGYISTGPRIRWRIFGAFPGTADYLFQIWPMPGNAMVLGFEYLSSAWVVQDPLVASGRINSFTADAQTCIFPDRLMVLGLKKKYFEIKGFDTQALTRDYNMHLDIAKAADGGSATLAMNPRPSSVLIGWENIPDSGYGS